MSLPVPGVRQLFDGVTSPSELAERGSITKNAKTASELADAREEFVDAVTKATIAGAVGETVFGQEIDRDRPFQIPSVAHNSARADEVRKGMNEVEMAKSAAVELPTGYYGGRSTVLAKEWTLSNPVSTGLIPFDLEAPAKLLTPRPTPLRNSTPRLKGQGGARRFKVISGFTGTSTGGATTVQPGINEGTTNVGPGGLSYIRGPYINYDGYDVTFKKSVAA